ncbi:MAG: AAA family ATPase [Firmicutes bacterium]|nr:AAA family ATPase [Bacillota bacterium]MDD4694295.1 AAA family ATPase [Bacillota bacterium]
MISWVNGVPYEGQLIYLQPQNEMQLTAKAQQTNPWLELESLIGLAAVKTELREICAYASISHKRKLLGLRSEELTLNMAFVGNPGTGKTTVARIVSRILKQSGVLNSGHLIEVERADLVGEYVGHTARRTREVINKALGGVLFIDEAYSLARGGEKDFGKEALDALVKAMEDHRHELVVIAAGYPDEMAEFLKLNPGLVSRMPINIKFADYSKEELMQIALLILASSDYRLSPKAVVKLRQKLTGLEGNGRDVRNILEQAMRRQAVRLEALGHFKREDLMVIRPEDLC